MRLVNVYREPTAVKVLYELLRDRPPESHISHRKMPSFKAHAEFVRSRPYRYWYLIRPEVTGGFFAGDLHVTHLNEIGVFIASGFRNNGLGGEALQLFMKRHRPLPAVTAKRIHAWLAHIAIANHPARRFFSQQGFKYAQLTMSHE